MPPEIAVSKTVALYWGLYIYSASNDIHRLLYDTNVPYRLYKCPLFEPAMRHLNLFSPLKLI
jgi:hypothetical protein